jgi:CDP-diacylglycerol--serine O-phosphatidyltransferase
MRVAPEMVLPLFVSVVFFIALLIGYPWHMLSIISVAYLLSLPIGWKSYRAHESDAAAQSASAPTPGATAAAPTLSVVPSPTDPAPTDRPARLN